MTDVLWVCRGQGLCASWGGAGGQGVGTQGRQGQSAKLPHEEQDGRELLPGTGRRKRRSSQAKRACVLSASFTAPSQDCLTDTEARQRLWLHLLNTPSHHEATKRLHVILSFNSLFWKEVFDLLFLNVYHLSLKKAELSSSTRDIKSPFSDSFPCCHILFLCANSFTGSWTASRPEMSKSYLLISDEDSQSQSNALIGHWALPADLSWEGEAVRLHPKTACVTLTCPFQQ